MGKLKEISQDLKQKCGPPPVWFINTQLVYMSVIVASIMNCVKLCCGTLTGWEEERVSSPNILRLIFQGRFLHGNVTLGGTTVSEQILLSPLS